jgi:hypothetical protein
MSSHLNVSRVCRRDAEMLRAPETLLRKAFFTALGNLGFLVSDYEQKGNGESED